MTEFGYSRTKFNGVVVNLPVVQINKCRRRIGLNLMLMGVVRSSNG